MTSPAHQTPGILIVGSGGHARVLIGVIQSMKRYRIKGLLKEQKSQSNDSVLGWPIVGTWDDLERLKKKGIRYAALAVGDNAQRERLNKHLATIGFKMPALIHKDAYVEPTAAVENGVVICLGALVGAAAVIKEGSLVNTGSIIDHETVLNPFCHIAPGCAIAGRVSVGTGAFIGVGSRVIDHITIGAWSVIGAGSVVVRDIAERVTAFGVPAQVQAQ